MRRYLAMALVPLACMTLGCPGDGTGLDEFGNPINGPNPPTPPAATLSQDVQPILSANCALSNCHAAPNPVQSMNLSAGLTRANTVDVPANELPSMDRIEPGDPDNSYLVHKVQGTHLAAGGSGSRMPLGGTPLTQNQIDAIRAWIAAGADDN